MGRRCRLPRCAGWCPTASSSSSPTAASRPGGGSSALSDAVLAYVFWHRPRAGEDVGWYEDWYLVEDWNALGRLNEVAITGARQPPHDVAAALAREGIAGIYGLIGGRPEPPEWAAWVAKPRGTGYADFEEELVGVGAAGSVWKRQMTLGPTPEFVVLAPLPLALPWPTVETSPG